MRGDRVKKKCTRCGHVARVRPRQARCRQPRFGRNSYACWGLLEVVRKAPPPLRYPAGRYLAEPGLAQREREETQMPKVGKAGKTSQQVAQEKAAAARRKVDHYTREAKRATTLLHQWQRKLAHYEKRAALTDEQVEAERQARKAQAVARQQRTVRRGINLGGDR